MSQQNGNQSSFDTEGKPKARFSGLDRAYFAAKLYTQLQNHEFHKLPFSIIIIFRPKCELASLTFSKKKLKI